MLWFRGFLPDKPHEYFFFTKFCAHICLSICLEESLILFVYFARISSQTKAATVQMIILLAELNSAIVGITPISGRDKINWFSF